MATYNGTIQGVKIASECFLPNGDKVIRGRVQMGDNYYTGGDALNLANWFSNSTLTVLLSGSNGWTLEFNQAAYDSPFAGKIKAYASVGNTIGTPFPTEAAANTSLSGVNVAIVAFGKAK